MHRKLLVAGLSFAALAAFGPGPASADPQAGTHVDSVTAAVGATTLNVSGAASFVDVPVLVGEDPSGDSFGSGYGGDVTTVTLSRPVNGNVFFTLGIADQPAATGGTPEFISYDWDIGVRNADVTTEYKLHAQRSAQAQAVGTNPVFRVYRCTLNPSTGVNECGSAQTVSGVMSGGIVQWQVPLSRIGAVAGSIVAQGGDGITVTPSASGLVWGGLLLDSAGMDEEYTVPGQSVALGIAPAGTPESAVPLTATATVNTGTGAFSGALPKPASGSYVVAAKACYGAGSCGLASTTMTV